MTALVLSKPQGSKYPNTRYLSHNITMIPDIEHPNTRQFGTLDRWGKRPAIRMVRSVLTVASSQDGTDIQQRSTTKVMVR